MPKGQSIKKGIEFCDQPVAWGKDATQLTSSIDELSFNVPFCFLKLKGKDEVLQIDWGVCKNEVNWAKTSHAVCLIEFCAKEPPDFCRSNIYYIPHSTTHKCVKLKRIL